MKKGDLVKCVYANDRFTVGKTYKVLAGEGDADIGITSKSIPVHCMDKNVFNVKDDDGDIRFVCTDGPYSQWQPVKNKMKPWLMIIAGCVIFWLIVLSMFW